MALVLVGTAFPGTLILLAALRLFFRRLLARLVSVALLTLLPGWVLLGMALRWAALSGLGSRPWLLILSVICHGEVLLLS